MPSSIQWLIRLSQAPSFSALASAGVDVALACGAFGQTVTVVLEGDGLELLRSTQTAAPDQRNLYKQIASLPLYDIDEVFVVAGVEQALPTDVIEDLDITNISPSELPGLLARATHVVSL